MIIIVCGPKTSRLPIISPAKIALFSICREFQFGICHHGKLLASLWRQGQENALIEGTESWEDYSRQTWLLLAELLPGKKSHLSFSCPVLLLFQGMRAPPSGLPTLLYWGFCLLIFYKWKEKEMDCALTCRAFKYINNLPTTIIWQWFKDWNWSPLC